MLISIKKKTELFIMVIMLFTLTLSLAGCSDSSKNVQTNTSNIQNNEVADYCINPVGYTYWYEIREKSAKNNLFYETNKEGNNTYHVQSISTKMSPFITGYEGVDTIYQIKSDSITCKTGNNETGSKVNEISTIKGSYRPLVLKKNAEWLDEYVVDTHLEAVTVKRQCVNLGNEKIKLMGKDINTIHVRVKSKCEYLKADDTVNEYNIWYSKGLGIVKLQYGERTQELKMVLGEGGPQNIEGTWLGTNDDSMENATLKIVNSGGKYLIYFTQNGYYCKAQGNYRNGILKFAIQEQNSDSNQYYIAFLNQKSHQLLMVDAGNNGNSIDACLIYAFNRKQ